MDAVKLVSRFPQFCSCTFNIRACIHMYIPRPINCGAKKAFGCLGEEEKGLGPARLDLDLQTDPAETPA